MRAVLVAAAALCAAAAPAARDTGMRLASADLRPCESVRSAQVNSGYGCHGENRSPALAWDGAPPGTKSFAVSVFDPDAPGGGWWHWIAFNLPSTARGLPADAGAASGKGLPPPAAQGRNDFGPAGYGGPCPPLGQSHRYVFTVYALKTDRLALDARADGPAFAAAIDGQVLAKAALTATYGR